ncbi:MULTISPECIES: hypothetical protein [Pseudonocardia]|uniref:Uncharacterized protein n=1 Tax=Pseudonocardia dioxanivorans (strain ATCC 55486 / DSM 44775 / JCM 13855 / CB1190) TaxID=675635 RepID=F4CLH9_PSEUX|nr:hypothetical protein [Pseudonocardia dioxanivorans]AEA27032.1 hypothetical protein Psed_4889 [Pseudonocardia dioxanivorans CB1190]
MRSDHGLRYELAAVLGRRRTLVRLARVYPSGATLTARRRSAAA